MKRMTTAELRGYQRICDDDGMVLTVACDQRGGIRKLLAHEPERQKAITDAMLGDVKADVVRHLAAHAPGVLLDPVCALPRVVEEGALSRSTALIVGLDASGYDEDEAGHWRSRLATGIDAARARRLGAEAGKIMVYLRADRPEACTHNLAILRHCIEDFAAEDMLLVVEFLTHPLRGEAPEAYREAMPALVEGAARLCLDLGAKLLKIPYPGSRAACEAVTKVAGAVPWAVLSAGVDHAAFMPQVETALAAGASGVIAGRSLWKDCVFLDRARTREALVAKAVPRLREIKSALARHARPRAAA